jgi:hypothetical protein
MEDFSAIFRQKLSNQAEACARKTLERLQKDLQGPQALTPEEVFYLSKAADILLAIRDSYGTK